MRDLRSAFRSLLRRPSFSLATLGSIAVGVGIAVAVFHVVRIEPGFPPRLSSALELEGVRSAAWSQDVNWRMLPAAELQGRSLERLVAALATMAVLALTIAGLNVAVLLLRRAVSRRRELALRSALGATPGRLAVLPLAEGAILGVGGTALGALLGLAGGWALRAMWPHSGGVASSELYPLALLFGLGAALAAPLGSAVATRIATAAGRITELLAAGVRTSGDARDAWLRSGLAVTQLAVAAVLLSGAAILVEGQGRAEIAALRYDPTDTLHTRIDLTAESRDARARLLRDLFLEAREAPGIKSMALSTPGGWFALGDVGFVRAECGNCYRGGVYVPISVVPARHHAIGPGFFADLDVEVAEGREFDLDDGPEEPRVAMVNRAFAISYFQDGDAIGRSVQVGGLEGPEFKVVGVVEDVARVPDGAAAAALYLPILQAPPGAVDLLAWGDGDMEALADALAPLVAGPGVRLTGSQPLVESLEEQRAPLEWLAAAFAVVGALALALALYGLASVMLQIVDSRRKEIGVRRALGATPGSVVRMIMGYALKLALVGGTLGLWGSLILTAWLGKVDPGLRLFDPARYGMVLSLILAAAAVGAGLSARAAVRVTPREALAAE